MSWKYFSLIINWYIVDPVFHKIDWKEKDWNAEGIKKVGKYNKYLCFYPESWFFTKFYEKRTDVMCHEICEKAGFKPESGIEIFRKIESHIDLFEAQLRKEVGSLSFDPNYTYSRYDVNKEII